MAKVKTLFVCQECGASRPKWEGRCSECGAWNSLIEEQQVKAQSAPASRGWTLGAKEGALTPLRLDQPVTELNLHRSKTGYQELDRVLGGGLVPGSYVLVGGDPGVGKSTLLLQMAGGLAREGLSVLYASAEESVQQTALRAQRLGVRQPLVEVLSESNLQNLIQLAQARKPKVLVVDSIQTVYLNEISSAPGSVSQVRECASQLMGLAKGSGISVFIIGHVTKEGQLAGPQTLAHMVDTVLSFEGDSNHQFRLLRALKNRFGATNELGVFQMAQEGLREVTNPSEFFLEERGSDLIGSAVFAAIEGSRPLLCEIQALASPTTMHTPRRTSLGFDVNRVHLLAAVLDKHLDLNCHSSEIYINVVGGLKLTEPSADLAVAASLISSIKNHELMAHSCFFGEVGLTGEVRASTFAEDRVKEALKLGFKSFVLPDSNRRHLKGLESEKVTFHWVKNVGDLEKVCVPRPRAKGPSASFSAQASSPP